MALIIGILVCLLFGYLASLPAIIFKKVSSISKLNWWQIICFLVLGTFIYTFLGILLTDKIHPPVIGYIVLFYFVFSSYE